MNIEAGADQDERRLELERVGRLLAEVGARRHPQAHLQRDVAKGQLRPAPRLEQVEETLRTLEEQMAERQKSLDALTLRANRDGFVISGGGAEPY